MSSRTSTSRKKWPFVVGAAAVVFVAIGAVGGGEEDPSTDTVASSTQLMPVPASPAPSSPPPTTSSALPEVGIGAAPAATAAGTDTTVSAALSQLAALPVKGRAPKTGYSRDHFGQAWSDDVDVLWGHNGCDQRNDILKRDLTDTVIKPGSNGCRVESGTFHDPYTGTTIAFVRGEGTSDAVQIDHVVSMSNSWQTGAQQLDERTRRNLANDPRNLMAADGPTNSRKSDGDAATWLPPNKSFRCAYVAKQIEVKAAYNLWVTQPEHDAMANVLGNCAQDTPITAPMSETREPIPAAPIPPPATTQVVPAPAPAPVAPAPQPFVNTAPSASGAFKNCTAARAAGAAPVLRGDPGYGPHLDRDGDGIGCDS